MSARTLTWRWHAVAFVVRALRWVLRWRIDVRGLEHVPRGSGAVLAFNHHGYVDFIMLGWAVVRGARRPLRFLGKREIWESPWVGWAPRLVDAIPVDRASVAGRAGAFDAAVEALRAGDLVAIAPEQTISPSFELLPFRSGAVRMAKRAGVPVVPVVGWGSHRFSSRGIPLRLRLRLPVTVAFGSALHPDVDDDPVELTTRLRERMERMLTEVQRTYADGTPAGARWVPERLGGSAPAHEDALREYSERSQSWSRPAGTDDDAPRAEHGEKEWEREAGDDQDPT